MEIHILIQIRVWMQIRRFVTAAASHLLRRPDMSYHRSAFWRQSTQIFLNNQENISSKSEKYLYKYKCKFKLDDQVSVPAPGLIAWRGPSVHSRERKAVQGTLPLHWTLFSTQFHWCTVAAPALVLREKSLGIEKSGMMGGGSGGDNGHGQHIPNQPHRGQLAIGQHVNRSVGQTMERSQLKTCKH